MRRYWVAASLVVIALSTGVGCESGAGNGNKASDAGMSANSTTGDKGVKHRMGHETGFTYPAPDSSDNYRTVEEGRPFADINERADNLGCTKEGEARAQGTISNRTTSTNDYHIRIDFYSGDEAYLGKEVAMTYVQVYGVQSGETVKFRTAAAEGENRMLTEGPTVCRLKLATRNTNR